MPDSLERSRGSTLLACLRPRAHGRLLSRRFPKQPGRSDEQPTKNPFRIKAPKTPGGLPGEPNVMISAITETNA